LRRAGSSRSGRRANRRRRGSRRLRSNRGLRGNLWRRGRGAGSGRNRGRRSRGRGSDGRRWPEPRGFRSCFPGYLVCFSLGFSSGFLVRQFSKMRPDYFGRGHINGARMGLLFGNPRFGQIVNNRFGLYLEVAGELIDADLIWFRHYSVGFSSSLALFESAASALAGTLSSSDKAPGLSIGACCKAASEFSSAYGSAAA